MLEGCELSKTRSPIDTGCEKRWYLIDSDHALPPTAGQKKRQVADGDRHGNSKNRKENGVQWSQARSPGCLGSPAGYVIVPGDMIERCHSMGSPETTWVGLRDNTSYRSPSLALWRLFPQSTPLPSLPTCQMDLIVS